MKINLIEDKLFVKKAAMWFTGRPQLIFSGSGIYFLTRCIQDFIWPIILIILVGLAFWSNQAQASKATGQFSASGESVAVIKGFSVSDLHFRLGNNKVIYSTIEFNLDQPAKDVQVSFEDSRDRIYDCINVSGHHWICDLPGLVLSEIHQLSITASN